MINIFLVTNFVLARPTSRVCYLLSLLCVCSVVMPNTVILLWCNFICIIQLKPFSSHKSLVPAYRSSSLAVIIICFILSSLSSVLFSLHFHLFCALFAVFYSILSLLSTILILLSSILFCLHCHLFYSHFMVFYSPFVVFYSIISLLSSVLSSRLLYCVLSLLSSILFSFSCHLFSLHCLLFYSLSAGYYIFLRYYLYYSIYTVISSANKMLLYHSSKLFCARLYFYILFWNLKTWYF